MERKRRYIAITQAAIYALVVVFISALVMTVVSVQYANYVDRESNTRWCGLMTTLDNAYTAQPPTTETGKTVAAEIHKLRNEFAC